MMKPPEPSGIWLRCNPPLPAHLLSVLHWGKGDGKSQELHSELVTKQKFVGWKPGVAKAFTKATESQEPTPELFGEVLPGRCGEHWEVTGE